MPSRPPVKIGSLGKMGISNSRSSISSMSPALWLDAADTNTITETAGSVSQWKDKSGNACHATQNTTSKKPMTGIQTVNDHNVLRFDEDTLVLPTSVYPIPNGDNTTFIVGAKDSETGSYETYISMTEDGGTRFALRALGAAGQFQYLSGAGATGAIISENNNTTPHIFVGRRNNTSLSLWVNGGIAETGNDGNNVAGINAAEIGSRPTDSYSKLTGIIGEIVIFNRALTDVEIGRIGKYLSQKWGITWTDI